MPRTPAGTVAATEDVPDFISTLREVMNLLEEGLDLLRQAELIGSNADPCDWPRKE